LRKGGPEGERSKKKKSKDEIRIEKDTKKEFKNKNKPSRGGRLSP